MAIGVKVMKRPTQQTSYLRATLKGMALTFSHLLRPKVTMQYPEEKSSKDWTLSSRWRGTRYIFAMWTFSSSVYPLSVMSSIRSSSAGWIVPSWFAVAMKSTRERSSGISR